MKVRHIHASPEEYIAVHRDGSGGSGGSGGDFEEDMTGCLIVAIIGFAVYLIITFWKFILCGILLIAAGWLIWKFRGPIRRFLVASFLRIVSVILSLQQYFRQKRSLPQQGSRKTLPKQTHDSDYGKIIQRR
ncbi:MAG TPA: hypothetical protein DE060_18645 [Lentisphaeria bacterium]|nr:hypothetical protein [Lentisphaeria bacterium]HCG51210.1 hypothetical protein [Lentisphaeria bacterium]